MVDTANEGKLARRLAVKFTGHSIDTLVPSFITKDELWVTLKVEGVLFAGNLVIDLN